MAFPISGQLIEPLSLTVFEIFSFSYIWFTTLTFLGHVTSSVMWPMDSPLAISYRCSIVTKCVSPAVFEMFGSKVPNQCKSSLRMRDITWPVPLCKIWIHILISHPHIAYSLWHFYWAPMKIKGCLLLRDPMLNVKSSESIFKSRPKLDKFWRFWGSGGSAVSNSCDSYSKRHVLARTQVVWAILRQNRSRGVTSRSVRKKSQKVTETPIGKTCRR